MMAQCDQLCLESFFRFFLSFFVCVGFPFLFVDLTVFGIELIWLEVNQSKPNVVLFFFRFDVNPTITHTHTQQEKII
eukprot:m.4287 g.4287  ORF g.4287 m.4287 type:complete len:77 (-) comp4449_c0_seq1:1233-1463(-)